MATSFIICFLILAFHLADMDDAKAVDLVKTLVAHHVALASTFMINYRG